MSGNLSYDDLLANQRKEKKDFLAKIQKLKHGIPKGDKKRKKEVTCDIAEMLAELDMKHDKEVKELQMKIPPVIKREEDLHLSEKPINQDANLEDQVTSDDVESSMKCTSQKISKAQKRRNRKSESAKERQRAIAAQELCNLSGNRHIEFTEIKRKLDERHLTIYEVPSDGNCLYNAVEHQLCILNLQKLSMQTLRKLTSEYLLLHKEDFIPFLTDLETGDTLSEEQYVKYCEDILNSSAWGGHVEVQVLSAVCEKPIEVIQATGCSIIAGNENDSPRLIISYHRHAYGLGEHYNSVVPCSFYVS